MTLPTAAAAATDQPGRPAGSHRNIILARAADRARHALAEHPEGAATRLRGFLT